MRAYFSKKRICVTGGAGFLGRAVCQRLEQLGPAALFVPRSSEFDLTRASDTARLFDEAQPDVVLHLAAEVGGIGANELHPGRFFYANMAMGLNLIEESRRRNIRKFVQVGSVCSYPKYCRVPFSETELWDGFPEETNAPYGVAKRALGVMLDAYRQEYGLQSAYVIPVNLYGPGDNFDPVSSHVIPALIRRFCAAIVENAGIVTCWGTGQATREFLFVEDAADAIVLAAQVLTEPTPVNLGTGQDISIAELARKIAELCGFKGRIEWDSDRPDGQPQRRLDTTRAAEVLGWRAKVKLDEGLARTVQWWRKRLQSGPAMSLQADQFQRA